MSACVVSGQDLPQDDALLSRSILLQFGEKKSENSSEIFHQLQALENTYELSYITAQLLDLRPHVQTKLQQHLVQERQALLKVCPQPNVMIRLVNNYALLLAMYKTLEAQLQFPFTYQGLLQTLAQKLQSHYQLAIRNDEVRIFWEIFEYLCQQNDIVEEVDYRIEATSQLNLKDKGKVEIGWQEVLYLPINRVYPAYREKMLRQQFSPLSNNTLVSYLQKSPSYLGIVKSVRFDSGITSAYVFALAGLQISLKGGKEAKLLKVNPKKNKNPSHEGIFMNYTNYTNYKIKLNSFLKCYKLVFVVLTVLFFNCFYFLI